MDLPNQPLSQTSEDVQQKLRYIWVATLGLWVCAFGRWVDGNALGAANDFFSSAFGVCIFQDDLLAFFGISSGQYFPTGGASCLFPFAMLAGINCFFDFLSLAAVCNTCFRSVVMAESTLCSGCFFTLGAAVFQASGSILSWQVYRTLSVLFPYGDIEAMQRAVVHAIECVDVSEISPMIGTRTGVGNRSDDGEACSRDSPQRGLTAPMTPLAPPPLPPLPAIFVTAHSQGGGGSARDIFSSRELRVPSCDRGLVMFSGPRHQLNG